MKLDSPVAYICCGCELGERDEGAMILLILWCLGWMLFGAVLLGTIALVDWLIDLSFC